MQTGTAGDSKQFGSSKWLLPSVLVDEELGKRFRDDRRQDKGPVQMVRVVHTQCVILLTKCHARDQREASCQGFERTINGE